MANVVPLPPALAGAGNVEKSEHTKLLEAERANLIALLAEVLESASLDISLDALVGVLQEQTASRRVSVSLVNKGVLTLRAVSDQAIVDASSSDTRLLIDAMQEACDREAVVRWPSTSSRELGVLVAHRALSGRRRSIAFCSVPIFFQTELIGALLLERRDGFVFTSQHAAFLEKTALLLAPVLALRMQAERGLIAACRARCTTAINSRLGTDQPGRRVLMCSFVLLLIASILIPVEAQIDTSAEIVPLERRLITTTRSGFVESVVVVTGEQVESGQLLAKLDTRELQLEASRSLSDIATAEVEFRAAMASFDRQASAVARARLAQARAQHGLVERRLKQSELRAPITGLILTADPGRALGAPVSRGDTLFEIAPADGFEVHLLVSENDIRDVNIGQKGELSLRARPDDALEISVQSIHPIAESGQGANRFRVRARLEKNSNSVNNTMLLRPGESGQAQLEAGTSTAARILLGPIWQRMKAIKWHYLG